MRRIKISSFAKIRLRIIFVTMLIHATIFIGLFSVIRISSEVANNECSFNYIDSIIENHGNPVFNFSSTSDFKEAYPNLPFTPLFQNVYPYSLKATKLYFLEEMSLRKFFSVKVKFDGENLRILSTYSKSITEDTIQEITQKIFKKVIIGERQGNYRRFLWKCKAVDRNGTYLLVFLDNSIYFDYLRALRQIRRHVLFMGQFFSFLFSFILSSWAIHMFKIEFNRQKRFLSDAGHELKTPVSVISANVDVLLSSYPGNKWLGYIQTETERMAELTKKLLYLARSDANENKFLMRSFNVCSSIMEVVLPFESVVFEQGKILEMDLPPEDIMVYADEASVKQVAVIFLDNALKNTEENAHIKISVSCQKNKCLLKVYNTGLGIKTEDLKKIFQRFYRSDTSRNRLTGGSGLGLAIASSIAEAHNTSVYAQSEYGKYAEFVFEIPLDSKKIKKAIG